MTILPLLILAAGCAGPADPLAELDQRYTRVVVDLGVAERDTARNIRNKEARRRKVAAERARVAFFRDPLVAETIERVRKEPPDELSRVKAEAYWRQLVDARAWTEDDKSEESRLIARLDEANSVEATWSSPDGVTQVPLTDSWRDVSRVADALSQEDRSSLAREYIEHGWRVVNSDLTDLVRLRNEVARRAGFNNYWELSLATQGLTPADVDGIIAELTEVVGPTNAEVRARLEAAARTAGVPVTWENLPLLRRAAGLERGRDEADTFFDTDLAEELVTTMYQDMGIATDGWQIYAGPSRYVRPGVDGFPVRPPDHVAIVMSQDQRWSVWQYEALAHEGGHAMWWRALSPTAASSPVLWGPPAPWFEGFAQFFERLVYEPAFARQYMPDLPATARDELYAWRAGHMAGWISDSIVDTLVERRLYEDPSNLEAVARYAQETRARLTQEPSPPALGSGGAYDDALTSSLLWTHPGYAQNYLFAYVAESWLHQTVRDAVGEPIGNPKVGPFLVDQIVHGDPTRPFPDRVAAISKVDRATTLKNYIKLPPEPAKTTP